MPDIGFATLLSFDRMLSVPLVKLIYFLGLVGIAISALISAVGSLAAMRLSVATGLGGLLLVIAITIAATLVWRVVCEVWIVIFGIYERLGEIRNGQLK